MNFKALISEADIRDLVAADLVLPSISLDGNRLLREVARRAAIGVSPRKLPWGIRDVCLEK